MNQNQLLMHAKECLDRVSSVPYPTEFTVGSWWKGIQKANLDVIRKFKTCEEAISHAQNGNNSGFDHRIISDKDFITRIVNFKLKKLELDFPKFSFSENPQLMDSTYSLTDSLIEVDGKIFSSMFLSHLSFYLRSVQCFDASETIKTILEIGSGYGALARIFKLLQNNATVVLVDLPESLFYAQIFLALNFPNARIKYLTEQMDKVGLSNYDFILVPVQLCETLRNCSFDIVINTGSLQEMPNKVVMFWMNFIQNTIQADLFYSWNYFLNNKKLFPETSREEANQICPILDPYWELEYFRINPEVSTIDCNSRNWLEVCVKRIPMERRKLMDLIKSGESLFEQSKSYPYGTNYWFADLWMAIWRNPKPEYLMAMLNGMDDFLKGKTFGIQNYNPNKNCLASAGSSLGQILYGGIRRNTKNLVGVFLKKYRPKYRLNPLDLEKLTEKQFYQDQLSTVA